MVCSRVEIQMVERHPALEKANVSSAEPTRSVGGGDRVTVFAELTKGLVLKSLMREIGPG